MRDASRGRHGVIAPGLAGRLGAAAGFRDLVAYQYGGLHWPRVHALASSDLDDLEAFCAAIATRAGD
jgi:uncharacterized protein YutE (UPF0331/DUF86 family)